MGHYLFLRSDQLEKKIQTARFNLLQQDKTPVKVYKALNPVFGETIAINPKSLCQQSFAMMEILL